ncbi:MAG: Gfo/Idh/MocA family oxidoreductase [Polyangiaceae bacterium]
MAKPVKFGVLGAARIAPTALIIPSRLGDEARAVVVAARDFERAQRFAEEHQIPRVARSYEEVVNDPEVDVVYNPLPMNLHKEWTIAALRAGKDVLCEKPFASNAKEAEEMVRVAAETGRFLVEAFHYRYHPFFERILSVVKSGKLGKLQSVDGKFVVAIKDRNDLRHKYETSGGATMDLGCYPLHWLRQVVGEEPEVVSARADIGNPKVDLTMEAELLFPGGVKGKMLTSMADEWAFSTTLEVVGERGRLFARNPLAPHGGHELRITIDGDETTEQVPGQTTFRHQLVAFVNARAGDKKLPTMGQDSIDNMRLIDAVYRAAGLPIRGA